MYGFYDECMKKLGSADVWMWCTEAFDALALAAVVDGGSSSARFAVHAGLTRPAAILSIKSEKSIALLKCPMKALCATSCGQTRKIWGADGA